MSGEDDRRRPGGIGGTNQRAGVTRVAHVVQHQDQALCGNGLNLHDRQAHRREDRLRGGGVGDYLQDPGGE